MFETLNRAVSPIKLIAIDIDGTLLPSGGPEISERNRQALRMAEAAGIEIVIATGRRQAYAMPRLSGIGLRPETLIVTSNGAVTRTFAGERVDRWLLAAETAQRLCGALRKLAPTMVFTFDRNEQEIVVESLAVMEARMRGWVEANRASIREVQPLERAFETGESPVQGMICGTIAEMNAAEAWLAQSELAALIGLHQTQYPVNDLSLLDILPPGCSKGTTLARVAERLGLKRDEVMAIGDNYNDFEMLEFAGHPVLMGNATADLLATGREKGWRIAPTNDEDGVAAVIEEVLAGNYEPACNASVVD